FWEAEQKKIKYEEKSENDIINLFWEYVSKCEQIITFNGRNFDLPFLILRSALPKIKPTRYLIGSRYNNKNHIDLLDKFTLYGLVRRFNIDFYCKAFGIQSPKSKGISGMDVKELYNAGRIEDIAIYCGEDVRATYELYKVWNGYLNI
ncbi:MAG TPA: 3'-5' exonuclease, partial [Ignavibacteria bacterium]|nr:3'-5' exonuclease [Ignavibacteria bacterium]